MAEIRYEEISKEKSREILEEVLNVFTKFSSNFAEYELCSPFMLECHEKEKKKTALRKKYNKLKWKDTNEKKLKRVSKKIKSYYDAYNNNVYKLTCDNQKYEMRVFDSPRADGFNSMLEGFDENLYLYVDIQKVKADENYDVAFGINKTTIELVELFEIRYRKQENIVCSCECIEELQKEYEGKKLKN